MPRVFLLLRSSRFLSAVASCSVLGVLCFFIVSSAPVRAQTTGTDPFTVDTSPAYPAPYQTVTLTPSSNSFDIDGATISVTVNGVPFYKGSGGAAINVPLGGPGTITNISVTAVSGGQSYNQKFSFDPASVALVVEPVSATHPFYDGKALVPSEGHVRLIAIPDLRSASGKELDPSKLEYTWKLGDEVLDSDSGIGQNVLDAQAPQQYRDADVSVTVSNTDDTIIAQADTTISPVDPITRIYEDDPLLGPLYDTALSDSFTMQGAEDSFIGVPYYFSGSPTLDWMVNSVDSGSDDTITVRSSGSGTGTALLGFTANDPSSTQSAESSVSVLFGQANSTGIFGL